MNNPTTNGGILHIPAGTRHGFKKGVSAEDLVVTESTEPSPDKKRDFFGDLMRVGFGGSHEVRQHALELGTHGRACGR